MIPAYFSRTYYLLYSTSQLTLYRVHGQRVVDKIEIELCENDDIATSFAQIQRHHPLKADDTLIVGLPMSLFNVVNFTLPSAASDNLDEAVGYELTRHIPFELNACLYHYTSSLSADQCTVRVLLALMEPLQPYLAALTASGVSITAVAPTLLLAGWLNQSDGIYLHTPLSAVEFIVYRNNDIQLALSNEIDQTDTVQSLGSTISLLQNHQLETDPLFVWYGNPATETLLSEWSDPPQPCNVVIDRQTSVPAYKSLPYKIEMASAKVLRKKKIKTSLLLGASVLFFLSCLGYPVAYFSGKYSALDKLNHQVEIVKNRAETLDALRQENQLMRDRYQQLATYVQAQPQVLDILKEITDIVSNETWLSSMKLHDRRITLHGTSSVATSVIEALASSPIFQDVHFDSPVIKKGEREAFTIVAVVK